MAWPPGPIRGQIARSAEAMLRRFARFTADIVRGVIDRLFGRLREDTPITRQNIRTLVNEVVRTIEYAREMQDTGQTPRRLVPVDSTIPVSDPEYRYRVIVVARDDDGDERFSTAIHVTSDRPLSPSELHKAVQFEYEKNVDQSQDYQLRILNIDSKITLEFYTVAAGRRLL